MNEREKRGGRRKRGVERRKEEGGGEGKEGRWRREEEREEGDQIRESYYDFICLLITRDIGSLM